MPGETIGTVSADRVALLVGGKSFPRLNFNTGYGIGGCPTYVAPGQEITGFIPYTDFALPPELGQRDKQLQFTPLGYACARSSSH